jgi:hypothetical protein
MSSGNPGLTSAKATIIYKYVDQPTFYKPIDDMIENNGLVIESDVTKLRRALIYAWTGRSGPRSWRPPKR